MEYIVLLQNKYAVGAVVVFFAAALYYHFHRDQSLEAGMVKELEYVIEQQAAEITELKAQLEKAAEAPKMIEKQAIQMQTIRSCPVPLKADDLPCTIKDPAAIIAIRGYKDESVPQNK